MLMSLPVLQSTQRGTMQSVVQLGQQTHHTRRTNVASARAGQHGFDSDGGGSGVRYFILRKAWWPQQRIRSLGLEEGPVRGVL